MSLLALSSIIAILIKFSLFWVGKSALFRDNQPLAFFLIALCALNLAELMSFVYLDNPPFLLNVIKFYYAAAILSATTLFYLSTHITRGSGLHVAISFATSMIITALIFVPDVMISGVESIGYSATRIPGKYFFILQIYLIGTLVLSIGILLKGIMNSQSSYINQRSLILFISVAPLVFFAILLTITLSLGIKVNATVFLSIMSSLMLAILIYTEKRYQLFKFLSYIPYTREHELRSRAGRLINQMIDNLYTDKKKVNFKEIRSELETILIEIAIEFTEGNKTQAAKVLGIGKATLHRKIEGLQL